MQSSAKRRRPKVGSIYNIKTSWGNGPVVKAKIIDYIPSGHHGKTIVDYQVVTNDVPGYPIGATHWAYIYQIEGFEDA